MAVHINHFRCGDTNSINMKKIVILIILIFLCSDSWSKNYWPYSKISPTKVQKQKIINYEDCMTALDDILTDEVKEHFKNQDSIIAIIEICNEIGGFFITNWNLNRYGETKGTTAPWWYKTKLPKKPENIPSRFIHDGIKHPDAMIRIIFSCYYKYLHKVNYDWQQEIDKLKTYWINHDVIHYYSKIPSTMECRENEILNHYYYDLMNEEDTVICLFLSPPKLFSKNPNSFYVTGLINFKIQDSYDINIKILNIETGTSQKELSFDTEILEIGDTISWEAKDWHLIKIQYFDYQNNTYYKY
jgi:hypothetical protein